MAATAAFGASVVSGGLYVGRTEGNYDPKDVNNDTQSFANSIKNIPFLPNRVPSMTTAINAPAPTKFKVPDSFDNNSDFTAWVNDPRNKLLITREIRKNRGKNKNSILLRLYKNLYLRGNLKSVDTNPTGETVETHIVNDPTATNVGLTAHNIVQRRRAINQVNIDDILQHQDNPVLWMTTNAVPYVMATTRKGASMTKIPTRLDANPFNVSGVSSGLPARKTIDSRGFRSGTSVLKSDLSLKSGFTLPTRTWRPTHQQIRFRPTVNTSDFLYGQ